MTPDQIAKSGSEHAHQTALFAYCAIAKSHGFDVANHWAENGELPKMTADVRWHDETRWMIPELEWIHAVHNQGHGDQIRGAIAKAEGVRSGVADIFWPLFRQTGYGELYCGLYIEMKKPSLKSKNNTLAGLSDKQKDFRNHALREQYAFAVCYTWREAANCIEQYFIYDRS